MIVLGLSEGPAAAAAVVVDDALVGLACDGPGDGSVPWGVVDDALRAGGVTREDVDVVAVAGRFSPLLAVRRRPWLRRLAGRAFSPLFDLQATWQGVLRQTGFGAWEADVAAAWWRERLAEQDMHPQRILTVDVHKALAEGTYRTQPADDLLVVSLQPLGDGAALVVHRGRAGQLDRLFEQSGEVAFHTLLPRLLEALDVPAHAPWRLDALAGGGTPDDALVRALDDALHASGRQVSVRRAPRPGRPDDPLFRRLGELEPADAAASIVEHLADTVSALVRRHARAQDARRVGLAGLVASFPRVVARVAEQEGIEAVEVIPGSGGEALAIGAAASQAGLAPQRRSLAVGPRPDPEACGEALTAAGLASDRRATLAGVLGRGGAVARHRGPGAPGPHALGARIAFVRADDPWALDALRERLGRPAHEAPLCITIPTPNEGAIAGLTALEGPLARGAAAPRVDPSFGRRYAPVTAGDGRVWMLRATPEEHPGLHQVVQALLRGTGCGAVAAFPLAEGDGLPLEAPEHAIELYRRHELGALQLGDFYVEREASR